MPDALNLVYLALYLVIWSAMSTGCFSLAALALRTHAFGFESAAEQRRRRTQQQARRHAQERLDAERAMRDWS